MPNDDLITKKMAQKTLYSTRELQQEIQRLKADCKNMEAEFDHRWEHVQKNFWGMAANTALYSFIKSPSGFGMAKDIIGSVWKADSIKNTIINGGKKFFKALAVRLGFKIMDDFGGGSKRNKEGEADEDWQD